MKPLEYHLEIYEPGSLELVLASFHSATPFMPMQKGDLLNHGFLIPDGMPSDLLRIVGVEHIVWEIPEHVSHKVMVYTETVSPERREYLHG